MTSRKRPGARPDRHAPPASTGLAAAAATGGVPAEEGQLKSAGWLIATALYLILFFVAQPARGRSFLLVLLPEQVISSWVQGDVEQFRILDRLPLVLVAGAILGLAYLGGRLSLTVVGCERGLSGLEVFTFATAVGLAEWSLLTLGVGLLGGLHGPWLQLAAVGVAASWAWGKWRQRRKALELELLQRAEDSYRKFLVTTRQPVVERHLRISAKIEAKIEELLDAGDELNAVTLRRLSEALASATGISARAAAINDRALEIIDREDGQGRRGGQSGKIPLVALGVSVNVAHNPGDAAPTVNITAEELPAANDPGKSE